MSAGVLVNRTPVVEPMYCGIVKEGPQLEVCVQGCGLNVGIAVPRTQPPCGLTLSVIAPAVPLTSDGKSPDLGSAEDEIKEAIRLVLKRVKKQMPKATGRRQNAVIVSVLAEAAAKASGGGRMRFSIRQLYYNVRPFVLMQCGKDLQYDHFCKVVMAYENAQGKYPAPLPRPAGRPDPPAHGRDDLAGDAGRRGIRAAPAAFNKVLYIEKKGFFPALLEAKFAERHDCALMSSDGYATGAVRDLLDMLGDGPEVVTIFCVHDADAYGTMIMQSLQDETACRPGRNFKVINLGLEPEEAVAMAAAGQVEIERLPEEAPGRRRRKPVRATCPAGGRNGSSRTGSS